MVMVLVVVWVVDVLMVPDDLGFDDQDKIDFDGFDDELIVEIFFDGHFGQDELRQLLGVVVVGAE